MRERARRPAVPRPKPKPAAPPGRRFASPAAAAAVYDCDQKTIRRWITSGLITGYRVGGRMVKVDLNEIEEKLVEVMPSARSA
jgi:hypothetical protein